jgi:hypothetical protein
MKKNKIISDWLEEHGDPEICKQVDRKLEEITKERSNQIIDEVYNKYTKKYVGYDDVPSKELFLFEIKNNPDFSERWGLKIEERELSQGERQSILEQKGPVYQGVLRSKAKEYKTSKKIFEVINQTCNEFNIPTKLITISYNDKTIESYE